MCPEIAKTGSFETRLAFFIRILDDSMGLQGVPRVFSGEIRVQNAPQHPLVIKTAEWVTVRKADSKEGSSF